MRKIFLLVISIIISACSCSSERRSNGERAASGSAIPAYAIPIIYEDYLHFVVNIDSVRGSFLFDTGFDNLCLDSIFFYENNLNLTSSLHGRIFGIGVASQQLNLITDSVDFSLGSHRYRTSRIPILDLKSIGGDFVDGLIGTKHFNQSIVEINYVREYIKIYDSTDSIDISDYKIVNLERIGTHFFLPVTLIINDTTTIIGNFLIDSASPGSTLTSSTVFINELDKKVRHKIRYYTMYGGIGGESSGYDFSADSLKISDFCLKNVILSYSLDTAGMLAAEEYIGIMGNNILDRFDALYDFGNYRLFLRPNENYAKPYSFDRLGFSYVDRCKTMGGWIVGGLYDNSPAKREGLRIDDKIISVNNIPVQEISYETQKAFFEKISKVRLVVSRTDGTDTIEFKLAPLYDL